jgi:hypothetical protein
MKAMIILLTGPMMLFFTLSVASTAEWCLERGLPVPWAWLVGIVAMDIVWCVCASKFGEGAMEEALKRYERFICKLFK